MDCVEDCWDEAGDDCRECMNNAWETYWSTWCPAEVRSFLDCQDQFGCDEIIWEDSCTTQNCPEEFADLEDCSVAAGVTEEMYNEVCLPLYEPCNGPED